MLFALEVMAWMSGIFGITYVLNRAFPISRKALEEMSRNRGGGAI